MSAIVTAGAVVATLEDRTVAYFYRGDVLHDGVPEAEVARLVGLGLVEYGEAFIPLVPAVGQPFDPAAPVGIVVGEDGDTTLIGEDGAETEQLPTEPVEPVVPVEPPVDPSAPADPPVDPAAGTDGPAAPVVVERPRKTSPKDAWVAYAVSQGAEQAVAEASTREDLIRQYGE